MHMTIDLLLSISFPRQLYCTVFPVPENFAKVEQERIWLKSKACEAASTAMHEAHTYALTPPFRKIGN